MKKMPKWPNLGAEIVTATREALDVDVSYYDHRAQPLYPFTFILPFYRNFLEPSEVAFWHILDFWGSVSLGWVMEFQGVLSPLVYA